MEASNQPIWQYAGEGDAENLLKLLNEGKDIESQDEERRTPLHMACEKREKREINEQHIIHDKI